MIYSLLLPFYRMSDILIAAALSIAVYIVSAKVFAPEIRVVEIEEKYAASGDRLADEMISKGQSMLRDIRVLNNKIDHPALTERVGRLERICAQIFKEIQRRPRKAPLIRRSLDYYLPVTLKLLDSYIAMSAQPSRGENVRVTMSRIEEIMDTLLKAFGNQLDGLYKDEALDVSTDITVLQGMLTQEGLITSGPGGSPDESKMTNNGNQTAPAKADDEQKIELVL